MKRRRFFKTGAALGAGFAVIPQLNVEDVDIEGIEEPSADVHDVDYVHLNDPEGGEWRITLGRDYSSQTIRFHPVLHIDQDKLEAKGIDVWSDEAIQYARDRYKAMRSEIGEAIMEWALKEGLTTMKLPLHHWDENEA